MCVIGDCFLICRLFFMKICFRFFCFKFPKEIVEIKAYFYAFFLRISTQLLRRNTQLNGRE